MESSTSLVPTPQLPSPWLPFCLDPAGSTQNKHAERTDLEGNSRHDMWVARLPIAAAFSAMPAAVELVAFVSRSTGCWISERQGFNECGA